MSVENVRYTKEQLLHLKESPLVHKPDGLPSIEQWMEVPQEQQTTQRKGRTQGGRGDDQAANQENGAQRHSLFPGKHLTRHSSTAPEDIVLGPPKTAFASSSRAAKSSEYGEKDDEVTAERVNIRDKFFKEREHERNKNGAVNGRRANREEGEGWTNVRGRRTSIPAEEGERPQRMGRFARETDGEETTPRRKKFEQPWGRENMEKEGEGTHKSWRDRRDDRWTRGNERIEEDPEWIDAAPKKDDIGMARFSRNKGPEWMNEDPKDDKKVHTQEDFQRWKERMKAGAAVAEDKENTPEPPSAKDTPVSSKPITPMVIEGKDMFGMWGAAAVKQSEAPSTTEGAPVPKAKPQKSSKFAKLFSPQEEQMPPQPPPIEHQQLPPPTSQTPTDNEDKEGFQRILNLLSNSSISQGQQSPASNGRSQGTPDRNTIHAQPQPTRHHLLRSREEKAGFIESVLSRGTPTDFKGPQGAFGPFSPATDPGQEQPVRPESIRSGEERLGRATPNSNGLNHFGIPGMMGPQAQAAPAQLSRDREFLLNLMTGPQRNTPPQPTQARPPPPPDMFAGAFMDKKVPFMEPPTMGPPQPPRGNPPPGLFEERQFPENDVRYQPQPPRRMPENPEIENAMRRASRFNLPIHLDDPAIAHIQRRNTADGGMPRNQSHNMGIPQQPPPDQMWTMKPPGLQQLGMQQPQERSTASMAPPPGFPAPNAGPQVRGPPGFPGNMGVPPFSTGNTPLGHPGMQVQRGPGPAAMFPGQGPPPGYFPPPPPGPPPGFGPGPGPMGLGMGGPQAQDMMGMRAGGPPPGMARPGPNGFDMFDRSLGRGQQGKGGSYRL